MTARPRIVAVIPARFGSTRFPGKALIAETGKPLIQHVIEAVRRAEGIERIIVATDDERIVRAVEACDAEAAMTRSDHPNGTSRIGEVAANLDADIIVNVQGDEPAIEPALIQGAVAALLADPDAPLATVASPFGADEDVTNPNVVKVVLGRAPHHSPLRPGGWRALYFSRSAIPFWRDRERECAADPRATPAAGAHKHVGLYVYRRAFLETFATLASSPLERTEQLEQLRVLEHGYPIAVAIGKAPFQGIDTREQYDAWLAHRRMAERGAVHEPGHGSSDQPRAVP